MPDNAVSPTSESACRISRHNAWTSQRSVPRLASGVFAKRWISSMRTSPPSRRARTARPLSAPRSNARYDVPSHSDRYDIAPYAQQAFRSATRSFSEANTAVAAPLEEDYDHLARQLARRGVDAEALVERAMAFRVAVPSWGLGIGRHTVRALSDSRRAPQRLREARGLRGGVQAHARPHPASRCTFRGTRPRIPASCARSRTRAGCSSTR